MNARQSLNCQTTVVDSLTKDMGKVLCVDDDHDIINLTKTLLKYLGYEVVTTCDPYAAMKLFSENRNMFSVVILDQNMPGMNGTDLSQELLAMRQDIPIILTTGGFFDERNAPTGIARVLFKPYTVTDLDEVIREVCGVTE